METKVIDIPKIVLNWSDWVPWTELEEGALSKAGVRIPNRVPGVYEVRYLDSEERLTIGKTSNLRMRLRRGLIEGKSPHSAGKRIRENEETERLEIRWAESEWPSAAEEALHKEYRKKHNDRLPKHVIRT
jgi:hypothetical protein